MISKKASIFAIAAALFSSEQGTVNAARDIEPGYDYNAIHKPNHRITENAQAKVEKKNGGIPTIHIVPHSHDDVGWLKTVDEYFYGDKQNIQRSMVEVELTSIVDSLMADSRRKFMEVEMKFFKMWWDN